MLMGFIRYLKESHKVSVIYLTIVLIVLVLFVEPSAVSPYHSGGSLLVILPFTLLFLTLLAIGFILIKVETKAARR